MTTLRKLALSLALTAAFAATGFAQINWTNQSPAGITDDIWSVAYGNGEFAAVTSQGKVLASSDGLIWSSQTVDPGVWLVSITYGNGIWVAVGNGGTILLSSDLQTWVNAKSATTNKLNGVLYDGVHFVAVGEAGTILTSPDAQTWTAQPSGVTGFLHGIDSGYNSTIVTGQGGAQLRAPNGGTVFASVANGVTADLEAITNNGNVAVAVGSNGTILYHRFSASSLTNMTDPFAPWTAASMPSTSARFRGLAVGDGTFVAAGELGTIMTSADGVTWLQRFSGDSYSTLSTATLLGAVYSADLQRFVVVGTGGTILVSNPTPTVFANVSTRGTVSSTQTLIGGFVIEGTAPRTVLIRADGPTLASFGVTSSLADPVLTVFDSKQNIVATNTKWVSNATPALISTAALKVGAFALPNPSADSALLLTLQPGAYTAVITSASGGSGTALFEAYTE